MSDQPGKAPKEGTTSYLRHIISGTSGAFLAVITLQLDVLDTKTNRDQVNYERISVLEKRLDEHQLLLVACNSQLAATQVRLDFEQHPLAALYSYMDHIQAPAWIKVWVPEEETFRMLKINTFYQYQYNVSDEFYENRTDEEVHGKELAKIYNEFDRQILASKSFDKFEEKSPVTGDPIFCMEMVCSSSRR